MRGSFFACTATVIPLACRCAISGARNARRISHGQMSLRREVFARRRLRGQSYGDITPSIHAT